MAMTRAVAALQILLLGIIQATCFAQEPAVATAKAYGDPLRFEKAIENFEIGDLEQPPPQNAIVCIGSSSMRMWHSKIEDDLAPLTIIARGFGGSNMNDALHYADRIVIPYKPRAVVIYEGDNDVAQGIAPEIIVGKFHALVGKIHRHLPEARIYFLAIKPSIRRWKLWPKMMKANDLIAEACAKDKQLTFVDVASGMLDATGRPRKDIFYKDNLHMIRSGYIIWRDALKPVLIKAELPFERPEM